MIEGGDHTQPLADPAMTLPFRDTIHPLVIAPAAALTVFGCSMVIVQNGCI